MLAEVELPGLQTITLRLLLGPTVGIKLNSDVDGGGQIEPSDDFLHTTEVGDAFGGSASVGIGIGDVLIGVRYQLSLTNINDRSVAETDGTSREPPTIRNRGLSVAVGIEL